MGFFLVLFCSLVILLWDGAPFIKRVGLLVGALLLAYVAEETVVVFRNGAREFLNMSPGLILLLLRFGIGVCAMSFGLLTLKLVRRRNA